MRHSVHVPGQFEPIFQKAQEYVARYFEEIRREPSKGTVEISGERYILVRAASLSVDFFETIAALYAKEHEEEALRIARQILFDMARAIGKVDARNFHEKMNQRDPIEKLAVGPVYFAHTGWAFVEILPGSSLSPDERICLLYDHLYSFEAAAWKAAAKKPDFPVCTMSAGYSSGWCTESIGMELVAAEIQCVAKGDPVCRFIMAPPSRIGGHIAAYLKYGAPGFTNFEVPGFLTLRESERWFRSIFETAPDGIFTTSVEGRFTSMNLALEKIVGWTPEDLIGRFYGEWVHPEDLGRADAVFQRIVAGNSGEIEVRVRAKSGIYKTLQLTGSPKLEQGQVVGVLGCTRDITERKKAEKEIRQLNAELERRVAERTKQLVDAQEELVRKEKLAVIGQVAGSVGHELRNPLGVMSNAVYFLNNVWPDADETVREYLGIIESEIANADRIVSDLLDSARIKPPFLQSVRVDELIGRSLLYCSIPDAVSVELDIPEGLPGILADPMQMQQVFRNLVSNAVDAMARGGVLKISAEQDAGTLRIAVKDNGSGIAPENLDKIFQPLFTTKTRGIGLGLVVVKNLVEANGGTLEVRSKAGEETTFSVILPVCEDSAFSQTSQEGK